MACRERCRTLLHAALLVLVTAATVPARAPSPVFTTIDAGPNIVIDGNSLSITVNDVPAYSTFLNVATTNVARGAQTTRDMLEHFEDVTAAYRPGRRNVLVAWEGTNDLYFGASVDEASARLLEYRRRAESAGWQVLLLTILPRASVPDPKRFETQRLAVNRALRRARITLIDVGADPEMGPFHAVFEPVFYQPDRVHLSVHGARRIATLVGRALPSR